MPRFYTPDGNYAQTLAYRQLCADLRSRRKKTGRAAKVALPPPIPFSPSEDLGHKNKWRVRRGYRFASDAEQRDRKRAA